MAKAKAKKKTTKKAKTTTKKKTTKKAAPKAAVLTLAKKPAPAKLSAYEQEHLKLMRAQCSALKEICRVLSERSTPTLAPAGAPISDFESAPDPQAAVGQTPMVSMFDDEPESNGPVVTKDDMVNAMQALSATGGMEVVRDVLAKFKAQRVSDVEPTQYADVVAACKTAEPKAGANVSDDFLA